MWRPFRGFQLFRDFSTFVTTSAAFFAIFSRFRTVFELGVPLFTGFPRVSLVFLQLAPRPFFIRPGILGPYSRVASSRILSRLMVFTVAICTIPRLSFIFVLLFYIVAHIYIHPFQP